MNYKLSEIRNNIQSYQNTGKIHNSFSLHCLRMLQVRENEISLRNSSGVPEYLRLLEGTLLTMQCKWTFTKRLIVSTLHENTPCYGNNHKKTLRWQQQPGILILRQFTQQVICRFSTQGISIQVSIVIISVERSIGLPWFSTKPQIITLFCLASRAAPS